MEHMKNLFTPLEKTKVNDQISYSMNKQKLSKNKQKDLLNLLYECPPDEDIVGKLHKQNTDFGFKTRKRSQQKSYCPCCRIQYNQKQLNFCEVHTTPTSSQIQAMKKGEKIHPLSSEILAYFAFIRIVIGYLILRCLIVDIWLIIGRYLTNVFQIPKLMMHKRFLRSQDLMKSSMQYHILMFLFLFFIIAAILYFKDSYQLQFQIYQAAQANCHSENKYSLLVQNIPMKPNIYNLTQKQFNEMGYEKILKEYFQSYIRDNLLENIKSRNLNSPVQNNQSNYFQQTLSELFNSKKLQNYGILEEQIVRGVNVCYDTSSLIRIQSQKINLMNQYHQLGKSTNQKRQKNIVLQQLKLVNETHSKMIQNFYNKNKYQQRLPFFQGSAFVTFDYQIYRDFVLAEYLSTPQKFKINLNQLIISPGDQPSTVEWQSFRHARQTRLRSRIYTSLILILVLLITFLSLSYCELYRIIPILEQHLNLSKKYKQRIKMIMISIITASINYLMSEILQRLAKSQKRRNKQEIIISLLTKNVINQFINSALIYYFISLITPIDIRFQTKDLVTKVESLIIVSGTIKLANNFITFSYAWKKIQHYLLSKDKFQIQANLLLERPQFDFVRRYSYYIVQLLTVSFYATLSPVVAPALAFIFVIQYFIDKLILFNKSSMPPKISFKVTDWTLYLAQWSLLAYTAGSIIFCSEDQWTRLTQIISYLSLILVIIYLAYRFRGHCKNNYFIARMFKSPISHQQCKDQLYQTFQEFNPWTYLNRSKGISDFSNIPAPTSYQIHQSLGQALGQPQVMTIKCTSEIIQ